MGGVGDTASLDPCLSWCWGNAMLQFLCHNVTASINPLGFAIEQFEHSKLEIRLLWQEMGMKGKIVREMMSDYLAQTGPPNRSRIDRRQILWQA